jgi:hypothetical protein
MVSGISDLKYLSELMKQQELSPVYVDAEYP